MISIGVALPNNQGVADPAALVELARAAERAGFESVWVSDHLFHAEYVARRLGDRPYHEPLVLLAAVAAATERVALGTSVLVLPWHHPVRLAKQVATLDQLSRGRVVLGVGIGQTRDEYAALGVPFERRGRLSDEILDALGALWTQDVPEWKGEAFAFAGLRFEPKCAQQPHPPLWIGGSSPAALERVALRGDGWHPLGLSPRELAAGRADLGRRLAAAGRAPEVPVAVRLVAQLSDTESGRPPQERRSCRGTPEEMIAVVRAFADAGATHVILDPASPDLETADTLLARVRDEVMPALALE